MDQASVMRARRQVRSPAWHTEDVEQTPSSSFYTERDDYTKPESKKRAREWLDEREYISRRLVETMTSKPSSRSQEECQFPSVFPVLNFEAPAEPAASEPAKSWSSEDTAEFGTFEGGSSRTLPTQRFRKYCAKNPFAAQAAAASLLAGAAWLEAVQALAAVKGGASEGKALPLTKIGAVSGSSSRQQSCIRLRS